MKINKNSALSFIGGVLIASSLTMSAAHNNTNDSDNKLNLQYPCGSATSTMGMHNGHKSNMPNMTEAERQAMRDKMDANLAQVLGISKAALISARDASTSMETLIKNSGLTETQFHEKMEALRKADMEKRLAEDVASGKITQAQADAMKSHEGKRGMGMMSH